jgi:hypothetical protein
MTYQQITRREVDRAAPLEFNERNEKPEKQANITIEAGPLGLTIRAEYTGTLSSIPQAIERLRAAGVLELVSAGKVEKAPAVAAAAAPPRKAVRRLEPAYNDAGEACCPKHNRALKEGQYGLYCSAKDESTDRGYCNLKFKD